MQYFGPNVVEGVAESWVEAEMSRVEVDGAWWCWLEVKMSWVEVDGAGWSWVHGLVIPFENTYISVSEVLFPILKRYLRANAAHFLS